MQAGHPGVPLGGIMEVLRRPRKGGAAETAQSAAQAFTLDAAGLQGHFDPATGQGAESDAQVPARPPPSTPKRSAATRPSIVATKVLLPLHLPHPCTLALACVAFQVARILRKIGVIAVLASHGRSAGMTLAEICEAVGRPKYPIQVLLESALSSGIVYRLIDAEGEPDRFRLSKTGRVLHSDRMTAVLFDFMQDVCYRGLFDLEQALDTGRPVGLRHAGSWATLYEGMDSLPSPMRESWFRYDHYFSDCTFSQALSIVFDTPARSLLDLGGNTGRWALACVAHNPSVEVTVVDLPQQIRLLQANVAGKPGADRIHGYAADVLDPAIRLPGGFDCIWMSQFLDCFSEEQIEGILRRVADSIDTNTRVYINEIHWDRQRFETGAFVLNQSSPYFTAIANGTSKFLYFPDLAGYIEAAGLEIVRVHDGLGWGHSLTECRTGLSAARRPVPDVRRCS